MALMAEFEAFKFGFKLAYNLILELSNK